MIKQTHGFGYSEYLKGDAWKCASSPTGAHHWIVGRHDSVCMHCQANSKPKPAAPAGTDLVPATVATLPTP
jgi:hypothetical protein